jgi:3-oxoacyl-[acyl-carrier protein] reductase
MSGVPILLPAQPVVIVSGGSRGLGRALIERCLADGYRVATYSRKGTPFTDELASLAGRACWQEVDGTDPDAVDDFVRLIAERFGRIDAVVNNAGVGLDGVLATMRIDDVQRVVNVNLNSALYLAQSTSKLMLRQRSGCIINVSSVNAIRGHAGVAVYSATKAALDGLTRSLARELGPRNIRVNSVAPGYFESDMVGELAEEAKARIIRRTPLGRLGVTADVVEAVLFLLSSRASFITGQTLIVDGGITC